MPLLIFFMAANLLPQQVIITPLYELYLRIHLPGWAIHNLEDIVRIIESARISASSG